MDFRWLLAVALGASTVVAILPAHAGAGANAPPSCTSTDTCRNVQEWQIPVPIGAPRVLAPGPDGAMWAWAPGADYVFRFDSSDGALLSSFAVPDAFHATYAGLIAGPDGNMWLTDPAGTSNTNSTAANSIIKISMSGQQTKYPLSPNGAKAVGPRGIVAGPPSDPQSMWFADSANANLIGRISLDGSSVQNWPLPGYTGTGFAIGSGPAADGTPNAAIYLATYSDTSGTDHVLRLEPQPTGPPKVTLSVPLPALWHAFSLVGGPTDPTTGKQDGVWLTDDTNDKLGRIAPDGTMTSWPVALTDPDPPSGGSQGCEAPNAATGCAPGSLRTPTAVIVGPDNEIWVAVKAINAIARFDPQTQAFDRIYRGLSVIVRPVGLAVGSDGNVWYDSVDGSLVGRVLLHPVTPPTRQTSAFTLSGPFDYYLRGMQFPLHQVGQPIGVAPYKTDSLEVAMAQSDRLQRVPTSLASGPPDADHEQEEANETQDPVTAAMPWRTIRIAKAGPRLILGLGAHTSSSEWITMYDDTVERVIPGNASVGDTWTSVYTVTSLAACCLTIPGVIGLSGPGQLAAGPNGNIWFTEFASGSLGLANAGLAVEETPPTKDSGPFGVVATDDNSVWFTETKADQIGVRGSNAKYSEYKLPAGSDPYGITVGPDGAVWFTMRGTNRVGRVDAAGTITSWSMPTPASQPTSIALGPDNKLYITEYLTGKVARMSLDSNGSPSWDEWSLPFGARSYPYWISAGPDGKMWVTLPYQNQIASLDPTATPAPTAPTELRATPGTQSINLSWSSVPAATEYTIYRSTIAGAQGARIATVSTPSYADSEVSGGTTYFYAVTASNGSGVSEPTAQVAATASTPPAPTPELRVPAIGYAVGQSHGKTLEVAVPVQSGTTPVIGASVSVDIRLNGVSALVGTATTDGSGLSTFTVPKPKFGTYTTVLTNVAAPGFAWDGVTPANSYSLH
jgi:streptogramin lyase